MVVLGARPVSQVPGQRSVGGRGETCVVIGLPQVGPTVHRGTGETLDSPHYYVPRDGFATDVNFAIVAVKSHLL